MDLIIGGYASGKLELVKNRLSQRIDNNESYIVIDETNAKLYIENPSFINKLDEKLLIVNHLHLIVKKYGYERTLAFIDECNKYSTYMVVISDEIGNGIIPLEREDRIYRDNVGSLLCDIAKRADSVERIVCAIPQKIK